MNNTRQDNLDRMMDKYVYGLTEGYQIDRIRWKIEEDPEWQLAYEEAVERKRLLAGTVRIETSDAPPASATAASVIAAADTIYNGRLRRRKILRRFSGGLAAAATILISVMWLTYAAIRPPTHTVRLIGQNELISGSTVWLKAVVTDLNDNPSPNIPVNLVLTGTGQAGDVHLASWTTDSAGFASGRVHLPAWEGDCKLTARAGDNRFQLIGAPIELKRASRVYLATDKPIYQPGQTIHIRTLVLQTSSLKPDAGRSVDLTVTDPAGNLIFRETRKLSEYGLAWADLSLDSLITPGRYRITATAGDDESVQTVEISHYKLPAFSVKISTDKPYYRPGRTLTGKVRLKYNFGKPVKGAEVKLELIDRTLGRANSLRTLTVTTGDSGVAGFEIPLPKTLFGAGRAQQSAHMLLTATATDSAGQENTGFKNIPVSSADIRIAAIPESGSIDNNVPARLFVVTSYPDGRPASTIVDIPGFSRSVRTDAAGAAVIELDRLAPDLTITARDERGLTGRISIKPAAASDSSLVLRTDRPIYMGGQTMAVEVIGGKSSQVFVDVVKDRQTVLTRSVEMKNGRGTAAIDIPPMLSGTLRLHAYKLDTESQWVGRDAVVIVKQAGGLKVAIASDKETYRPGRDAKLNFRVTDADGKPQAAAISLAGVDEAVFSLQQAAPGLEGLLNGLDEELLVPAIEVHGLSMAMMHKSTRYAQAVVSAAANEASGRDRTNPRPNSDNALHSLDVNNKASVMGDYRRAKTNAEGSAKNVSFWASIGIAAALVFFGVSFVSVSRDMNVLKDIKWGHVLLLLFVVGVLVMIGMPTTAGSSGSKEARDAPRAYGDGKLAADPLFREDHRDNIVWPDSPTPETIETATKYPTISQPQAKPVRTRTYFPETMLWRPQIITDPQGRANLTVPLADSITTWRLSGSAVSKTGRLGRVSGSVKVFQPFFVDVNAPTDLTRGDEISIPLVLYNYADKSLSVQLQCTGADGLVIVGTAPKNVNVDSGEVTRVMIRVKADAIGSGLLEILAVSDNLSDSIRREIRIAPPGRPASAVVNGVLTDGQQTINVPIPDDAVDGSVAMRLKLYPSTFSELMDGLEGVFRQPSGCFEQTSSTTYPNVMALSYMRANGLDSPETAAKAARYIQMGYQRLLTFEIKGGGFDWFGRGPANVVLTAYGLMEFADMAKVHNVDPKLLERTARWLGQQQTADGAWRFSPGCFHEPFTGRDNSELAITAYVTWAIAGGAPHHPAAVRGADYIAKRTDKISNDYTLALCANALRAAGAHGASELIRSLETKVRRVGKNQAYWSAGGGSNDIRATALAILAMRGDKRYAAVVSDALRWLAGKRDPSGTWGATQSTIMALKAITEGAPKAGGRRDADARLTIGSSGSNAAPAVLNIPAAKSDAVHTAAIARPAGDGPVQLNVNAQGADGLPYQVVVHYYTQRPATPAEAPVRITVDYDRSNLQVGQTVTVTAAITNTAPNTANMLLADVGTPPGFSVDASSLEKLLAAGKIERYTVTSRGVIFYITRLNARKKLTLQYRMTAKLPLKAQTAPTTVYPYYEPQQLSAAEPATFIVQ
ncbi:MAG: MG2 domain-containing protein [Phycisphaerae bacterium]|jgi:hypothetical protein|nr:MG2 domain-containing protein [Phycisphaerae bacterium]